MSRSLRKVSYFNASAFKKYRGSLSRLVPLSVRFVDGVRFVELPMQGIRQKIWLKMAFLGKGVIAVAKRCLV